MTSGLGWEQGQAIKLFGNFNVYSFTMLIGIVASIISILFFWKKNKYPTDILLILIIITIPSSIIGARLFFIIESAINKDTYALKNWYKIWEGGLSIQGGVFLPTIFNLIYLRGKRQVVDIRKAFGIILPNVLLGQAIGRWGNFANHEVYGAATSFESISWLGKGIVWNMYIEGEYRVPLFLIESFTSFVGYILIVWWLLNFNILKPGTTGGIYLFWYGLIRTIMEPFRTSKDYNVWYLVLSILGMILGLILIAYFEISGKKIYEKIKYKNHSYYYFNTKIQMIIVAPKSKWINA